MGNNIFSDEDIDSVLNQSEGNEDAIIYSLGAGLENEYSPTGVLYSVSYATSGIKLWDSLESELYDLFCNPKKREPKDWIMELINGDIRSLIIGILSAITTAYDVGLGIAIPAAALVLKKGIMKYCKTKKEKRESSQSVNEILKEQKIKSIKNRERYYNKY